MNCEKCTEEDKESTISEHGHGWVTLMGGFPYYDENKHYHDHDPNASTQGYICSNGHKWSISTYKPCCTCEYKWLSEYEKLTHGRITYYE